MNTPNYRDTFSKRAQSHNEAFSMYPDACRTEAEICLSLASLKPGEVLLDLPSAGGFLSRYISVPNIHVIAVDPCPELHALCSLVVAQSHLASLDCLPLLDSSVDAAICLAGLHHEPNPGAVFSEIFRVLKPGTGRVVIAEVNSNSKVANFLNGFIHKNNSNGHVGAFVDDAFVASIKASNLKIERDETSSHYWLFTSRHALGDCLQRMFGLDLSYPEAIADAVETELGIDNFPDGRIGMRWSLRMFLARRA